MDTFRTLGIRSLNATQGLCHAGAARTGLLPANSVLFISPIRAVFRIPHFDFGLLIYLVPVHEGDAHPTATVDFFIVVLETAV